MAMNTDLMRLMSSKMGYFSQRQSVLAENVANANTPGYKAKDLAPFTFSDAMKQTSPGMTVTNPMHLVAATSAGVSPSTQKMKSFETLPSGKSNDIEQQMMEVSKNAMDFQSILAVFHKFTGFIKMAIGK